METTLKTAPKAAVFCRLPTDTQLLLNQGACEFPGLAAPWPPSLDDEDDAAQDDDDEKAGDT
jgi:hypothetical protein